VAPETLSVPAVTTDLSGFGLLISDKTSKTDNGIYVLKRKGRTNEQAAKDLADIILKHSKLTAEQVIKARTTAREISEIYSWRNIIKEYKTAYNEAVKRINLKIK